ncbi:MAG: hypothetical protein ACRD2A_00670 [Vicinamibacterales bacterium]
MRPPELVAVAFKLEAGRFGAAGECIWSRVEGDYGDGVFDIAPDGRVLVAFAKDRIVREIRVVINWQQEVARKLNR